MKDQTLPQIMEQSLTKDCCNTSRGNVVLFVFIFNFTFYFHYTNFSFFCFPKKVLFQLPPTGHLSYRYEITNSNLAFPDQNPPFPDQRD